MGRFNLDKYFKDRIEPYSEELDTGALWDALDLDNEKKDRGVLFLLMGLIPLLFVIGFSFYFFGQEADRLPVSILVSESKELINNKNEQVVIGEVKTVESDQEVKKEKTESNNSIYAYANEAESINKPSTKNIDALLSFKQQSKISLNPAKEQGSEAFAISSDSESSSELISMISETKENTETNISSSDQDHNKSQDENQGQESDDVDAFVKTAQKNNNTHNNALNNTLSSINAIPKIPLSAFQSKFILADGPIDFSFSKSNIPIEFDLIQPIEKPNRFSLNVYSGYSFIQRNLDTKFPAALSPFIDMRNESESLLEAVSMGAEMRYKIKSGFYARVGIEYLSINEKFNWQIQSQEEVETDIVVSNYVSAAGDTTQTIAQGFGIQPIDKTWVNYNNHKMLSLPLSLGYETKKGPWSFFIEGSYHLNVMYNFNGKQLDYGGQVTVNPEYMNLGSKHSYAISTGVGYQLNPKLKLYVQPQYQSFLSSFTRESELTLEQRYVLYGLKVGVSCLLNGKK